MTTTTRYYAGYITVNRLQVFKSDATPNEESHPQYLAAIGPFRTKRGAQFMAQRGLQNPCCQTVADAEKLARKEMN